MMRSTERDPLSQTIYNFIALLRISGTPFNAAPPFSPLGHLHSPECSLTDCHRALHLVSGSTVTKLGGRDRHPIETEDGKPSC